MSDSIAQPKTSDSQPVIKPKNDIDQQLTTEGASSELADTIGSEWTETVENFEEMNLCESLLRGIHGYGFERPTPIQQLAVKPCIVGHEVIARAPSGTGKTATLAVAILQKIDVNVQDFQALILVPNRVLAQHAQQMILALGEYMGVTCHVCIGGTNIRDEIKRLETGMQIIVGTPGRVFDMIKRSVLHSNRIKVFALDETDEMLSRGFQEQIFDIFQTLETDVQVILFSATLPSCLLEFASKMMEKPVEIVIGKEEFRLEGVRQFYVPIDREESKTNTLGDLWEKLTIPQAVIYCSARRSVNMVIEEMRTRQVPASAMHGDMTQDECEHAIEEFRTGAARLLVVTDASILHADLPTVGLVLNYDLPIKREFYARRVGYCGRFPIRRVAISLVNDSDRAILRDIEQFYNTCISEMPADVAALF